MRISMCIAAGLSALVFGAGAALAEKKNQAGPKIYPYKTSENFCPAGLQPVTVSGSISCGVPNTKTSYQHALKHGSKKRRAHRVLSSTADCPIGEKGCTF